MSHDGKVPHNFCKPHEGTVQVLGGSPGEKVTDWFSQREHKQQKNDINLSETCWLSWNTPFFSQFCQISQSCPWLILRKFCWKNAVFSEGQSQMSCYWCTLELSSQGLELWILALLSLCFPCCFSIELSVCRLCLCPKTLLQPCRAGMCDTRKCMKWAKLH